MRSSARPHYFYGDPADVVERWEMDGLGCLACQSHRVVFDQVVCADVRNEKQAGVPRVGHRCPLFDEGD